MSLSSPKAALAAGAGFTLLNFFIFSALTPTLPAQHLPLHISGSLFQGWIFLSMIQLWERLTKKDLPLKQEWRSYPAIFLAGFNFYFPVHIIRYIITETVKGDAMEAALGAAVWVWLVPAGFIASAFAGHRRGLAFLLNAIGLAAGIIGLIGVVGMGG